MEALRVAWLSPKEEYRKYVTFPRSSRPRMAASRINDLRPAEVCLRWTADLSRPASPADQTTLAQIPAQLASSSRSPPTYIPLVPELREALATQKTRRDSSCPACQTVFFWDADKPIRDFRESWHNACREAGVPRKLLHDLRRTDGRSLVRAGVPEAVAMRISGHETRSVFERYNVVNEADLMEAARPNPERLYLIDFIGANGEGRTPIPLREPDPKSGASANSATFAPGSLCPDNSTRSRLSLQPMGAAAN
jgi:Phage integrase family